MVEGVLIAESLKTGVMLDDLAFTVTSINRVSIMDPAPGQAAAWTMITFRCGGDPDQLAGRLSAALDAPGWYVDFADEQRKYVVYPDGHIFSFERGDSVGSEAATIHGRGLGIPEGQLDWAG